MNSDVIKNIGDRPFEKINSILYFLSQDFDFNNFFLKRANIIYGFFCYLRRL